MPVAWTVKDSKGELLPRFIAGTPREVARKVLCNRYNAFRLEVSPSYRELFDRRIKAPALRRTACIQAELTAVRTYAPVRRGPRS